MKEIRVSKFDLSGNQKRARAKIYISVNWIMRDSSSRYLIQHRYYIYIYVQMHHWDIRTCYHHVERTRFSIDPSFDVLILEKKFKRRGFRKSDTNKKRGRGERKRKEGRKRKKERGKKGKVREGQRLFHYDRHVFPSSTNYDLFEFVRVLRVSSIFLARTDIRTRVFNSRAWIKRTCARPHGTKTNRLDRRIKCVALS